MRFDELLPLWSFLLALAVARTIAPKLIAAALAYGIVDVPKGALKVHKDPVPYLGGLVVFMSVVITLSATFAFDWAVLAILLCASIVVSVGLVDDLGTLTPKDKLLGQLLAALVLVKAGVEIRIEGWPTMLPEVCSVFFMLTCMNAFNILDVSDGLASTAAFVGAVALAALAFLNGDTVVLVFSTTIAGAALGFLHFNKQPARMYLGDTGSLLFGALLGALAMMSRYSTTNTLSPVFAPLAVLAIPFFDLALVIVARLAARKPIHHGSPDHFAVRFRDAGVSARRTTWIAGAIGACFAIAGLVSTRLDDAGVVVVALSSLAVGIGLLVVVLARFPARTSPRYRPLAPPRDAPALTDAPERAASDKSAS